MNKLIFDIFVTLSFVATLIMMAFAGVIPAYAQSSVPTGSFIAEYFNNKNLTEFVLTKQSDTVNFKWGSGSPDTLIDPSSFSARYTGNFIFEDGTYQFTAKSDDGIRVYLDNNIIINAWYDHPNYQEFSDIVQVSAGAHQVKVEYYEDQGTASLAVDWQKVTITPTQTQAQITNGVTKTNTNATANPNIKCSEFKASAVSGALPLTVTFTANFSDPDKQISSYIFNFGERLNGIEQTLTQSLNAASYTYTNKASFTASVQAKDVNGFLYGGRGSCEATVNAGTVTEPTITPTPTGSQTPAVVVANDTDQLPATGFFDNTVTWLVIAYAAIGFYFYKKFDPARPKKKPIKTLSPNDLFKHRLAVRERKLQ
jgi:hypothetical protein